MVQVDAQVHGHGAEPTYVVVQVDAQVHDHGADPLGGGHFEFLQNRRHLPRRGRRQRRRPLLSPLLHRASLQ